MTRQLVILIVLLPLWGAYGQVDENRQEFSLEEAQAFALENAFSVEEARINYLKAKETIDETRAMGLPQITSSLGYQWNPQIPQQPVPAEFFGGEPGTFQTVAFGVEHSNTATLQLNQLLLDASYFVALKASRVVMQNERLEAESAELDLTNNVSKSYYSVLIAERLVEILHENLGSLQENLFEVRELYRSGFTEEQDVDQLELLVNSLDNNLNAAKRQLEMTKMLLNFNMGREVQKPIILTTTLDDISILTEDAVRGTSFSYQDHVDYRSIEIQEKGARLQVTYDQMAWVPSLSGFVRHQQSNYTTEFDQAFSVNTFWIPSTVLGVSLNWTILEGLARPARIEKAKLDVERVVQAKKLTGNQLTVQYEQALSDYLNALESYKTSEKNVAISKKIRDKTRIKYTEGMSSSLDLTQVENQYLDTQRSYIQSLQSLLYAKEELDKALGRQ